MNMRIFKTVNAQVVYDSGLRPLNMVLMATCGSCPE